MGRIFLKYRSLGISSGFTSPDQMHADARVVQATMCHSVSYGGSHRGACHHGWQMPMPVPHGETDTPMSHEAYHRQCSPPVWHSPLHGSP